MSSCWHLEGGVHLECNKPAKYGIKLVLANDVHSKYLLAGIPYLGKQVTQPQDGQKELIEQYGHTNRNVTTANWFTSLPLVIDLLEACGMIHVGTVKANKREIPHVMKDKENHTP